MIDPPQSLRDCVLWILNEHDGQMEKSKLMGLRDEVRPFRPIFDGLEKMDGSGYLARLYH